jgi:hypothetical protein
VLPFKITVLLKVIWLAGTLLLMTTALLAYRRGLHREYPWFFRYILFTLGRAPVFYLLGTDYALNRVPDIYFNSYWIAEALNVGLSFFVIFEIYQHVAGSSSLKASRSTFFTLTVFFIVIAAFAAWMMDTPPGSPILRTIFVLTHTARTTQLGLLALLMVASLFFNFYWESLPFGFALGYGVYAAIELAATSVRTLMGTSANDVFSLSKVLGYQFAVVLWIVFIYRTREVHALKELPGPSMAEWLPLLERPSR